MSAEELEHATGPVALEAVRRGRALRPASFLALVTQLAVPQRAHSAWGWPLAERGACLPGDLQPLVLAFQLKTCLLYTSDAADE